MNRAVYLCCIIAYGCGGKSEDRTQPDPEPPASTGAASGIPAQSQAIDLVRKYRLFESEEQRDTMSKAVVMVNKVLGPDVPFRLHPSWEPGGSTDHEAVRVFLIDTTPPGKYGLSFVPRGEKCVFVDAKRVAVIEGVFSKEYKGAVPLPVDQLLAITLLHEAGHIFHGHWGGLNDNGGTGDLDLNVEENDGKRRESEADCFAGRQIKAGMEVGADVGRFATAMKLAVTLTMVSVNLTFQRLVDDFGATSLGLPQAFWDDGRSHPNLAYRMLKIKYEINPTVQNQQLIDDFEKARAKRREESEPKKR